jgi:hypothetical protein
VFGPTALGGIRRGPRRKSKEFVGSRSKTLIFSFRVFVAVHLHASGVGMGLGGEPFFHFHLLHFRHHIL